LEADPAVLTAIRVAELQQQPTGSGTTGLAASG
jgi:hypothetical protein